MNRENIEEYLAYVGAKNTVEQTHEWCKWMKEIPALNFKEDWNVKVIPPFGGAIARFWAKKGNKEVSVYLDCYDELGLFGEPYWEIYPYEADVFRCAMNDTETLLEKISEVLDGKDTE